MTTSCDPPTVAAVMAVETNPTTATASDAAAPVVDMSAAAIERRLATVAALYELMRSLMAAAPRRPPG